MVKADSQFRRWLKHKIIAFDTSFLILLLQDTSKDDNPASRVLRLLQRRSVKIITSTITLLEILVHPYHYQNRELVDRYFGYMTHQPGLELIPLNAEVADRAAEIRAKYRFKTPDAIQLASAIFGEATLFLTQDKAFRKQKEIAIGSI